MQKLLLPLLLLFSVSAFAQLRTFSIQPESALRHPAAQILLAGAGSVQGANGTFFHSDITVINYRNQNQRVAFLWMPVGQSAGSPTFVDIAANSGIVSEDFVASILHQSGLGALLISGVDSTQDIADPGALLYATERVWTPQPGTTGTTSQSFPAIATADINLQGGSILGQRMDNRYRTNVGIVNLDFQQRQFTIVQTTDDPNNPSVSSLVTVPARSMIQVPLPFGVTNALQIFVQRGPNVNPLLWMAYGSSVDNVTGDSWSSLAFSAQ
jgi:hypothetical protein